jgi:hypothetical protein
MGLTLGEEFGKENKARESLESSKANAHQASPEKLEEAALIEFGHGAVT